jgi:hypothetical protein
MEEGYCEREMIGISSYILVSFQLGKALRFGDVDGFFKVYDKMIEQMENDGTKHQQQLEIIKELARNISDLAGNEYHVFQQANDEDILSVTTDNDIAIDAPLSSILTFLTDKLTSINTSDSGVYSDDVHSSTEKKELLSSNISETEITNELTSSMQKESSENVMTAVIQGTFLYSSGGDLIKCKETDTTTSHHDDGHHNNYESCVQYLHTSWVNVQQELEIYE